LKWKAEIDKEGVGQYKYKCKDLINYANTCIFPNLANGQIRYGTNAEENIEDWQGVDRKAIILYFYTLKNLYPNADKVFAYYEPNTNKVIVADLKNFKFVVGGITPTEMY